MRINSISLNNFSKHNNSVCKKQLFEAKSFAVDSLQCLANQNIAFCAKKPIYVMDKDYNLIYFDSAQRASLILGLNDSNIANVLKGRNHVSEGYTFAYASDLEIKNKDGKKELNQEAIEKLKENFKKAKTVPVYVLDYDGNIKRYDSQVEAARELKVTPRNLNKASNGYSYLSNNCVIIPAEKVEMKDKKGKAIFDSDLNPILDYKIIKSELSKFSNVRFAPICTIGYLGDIRRYNDRQELADKTGFSLNTISSSLNNNKPTQNKIIVYENEILYRDEFGRTRKDINGNYLYDLSKINKRLQVFADAKLKPIKIKDVKGDEIYYYYFDHGQHVADELGISKQMVSKCLKEGRPFNGYYFEYLYPMYLDDYRVISD